MTADDPRAPGLAALPPADLHYDSVGLVTVVAQDRRDGRILMVAHADAEAMAATLETGELHLHSRSRNRLWRKGETSGNTFRVLGLAADCDGDAILATVEAAGPACHRGTRSCFDPADRTAADVGLAGNGTPNEGFAWLEILWSTIRDRATNPPPGSYTGHLLAGGVDAVGRKVTEEATEVLMAAKDDAAAEASGAGVAERGAERAALAGEAADLVYHALVLLAQRGLAPAGVIDVLRNRHGN